MACLRNFILLTLMALSSNAVCAQRLSISGQIKDDSTALANASVTLFDSNRKLLQQKVSDDRGHFNFIVTQQGSYLISATHVNHDTAQINFTLRRDTVMTIILHPTIKQNEEVTVRATQALIESGADPGTIVFNVARSLDAQGQTALETLKKTPGVFVDNNNIISLNGRTGVTIMIDGKLTYLSGREIADLLQSMPSSSIRSIEIINSPGAKYDAAGTAGIINIRTTKIVRQGFNAVFSTGLTYGISLRQNMDITLNLREKKWNHFFSYNHFLGYYTYDYGSDRLQNARNYASRTYDEDHRKRVNFRGGTDYKIDEKQTVGVLLSANFIPGGGLTDTRTSISLLNSSATDEILDAYNDYYFQNTQRYNANINYQYEDKSGRKLTIDADYGYFDKQNRNLQSNKYSDVNGNTLRQADYRTFNGIDIKLGALKVDYATKWQKGTIEFGGKIANVRSVNNGRFFHVKTFDSLDVRRSNEFSFRETINSVYASYKRSMGKWSWQAGMRWEHTSNKSDTNSRMYGNLFPSGSVAYTSKAKNVLSLSYSRRIDRPAYPDLNPFVYLLDELSFWQGNPYLKPQMSNRVSLQYVHKSATIAALNYARTKDFSARITDTVNSNQIVMIPRNVGNQTSWVFTLSHTQTILPFWEMVFNGSYARLKNTIQYSKAVTFTVSQGAARSSLVQRFKLSSSLQAEITAFVNSRRLTAANEISRGTSQLDIAIQKTFNPRMSLRFAVNDIYRGSRGRTFQDMDQFYISTYSYFETRQVRVNFTYRINEVKSRSRTTALDSENSRVR